MMTDDHVRDVCRLGAGAECCRYLSRSPRGWHCAKVSIPLREYIDRRVERGEWNARGDNCEGRWES